MRRPDLLILIAVWEFVTATLALIGLAAITIFAIPAVSIGPDYGRVGGYFGLGVALLVFLIYIGFAVAAGIGLLTRREWGRILSLVHAALSLFAIPIGTIIGILIIIYLARDEVRDYFQRPAL